MKTIFLFLAVCYSLTLSCSGSAFELAHENTKLTFEFFYPDLPFAQQVETAYSQYLEKIITSKSVVDFYSLNSQKDLKWPLKEILGFGNQLQLCSKPEFADSVKVFVLDSKHDSSYQNLQSVTEQSKLFLALRNEYSNLSKYLQFASASKENPTFSKSVEDPETVVAAFSGEKFTLNKTLFKETSKKQLVLKLTNQHRNLLKLMDSVDEAAFMVSEGILKSQILEGLAQNNAMQLVEFFDGKGGGEDLCYIGELIMNAYKVGKSAKMFLNDVEIAVLSGHQIFFALDPVLSTDAESLSQSDVDSLSPYEKDLKITTVYQKSYEKLYGIDGQYQKCIKNMYSAIAYSLFSEYSTITCAMDTT